MDFAFFVPPRSPEAIVEGVLKVREDRFISGTYYEKGFGGRRPIYPGKDGKRIGGDSVEDPKGSEGGLRKGSLSMRWSEQLRWRERSTNGILTSNVLKIVRKRLPFILEHLKEGEAVLEIGAFNRELGDRIKRYSPKTSYKSVDIDPAYPHDYSSLEEVKEKFDLVLLFEVIEHLDWDDGRKMVAKIFEILNPGGESHPQHPQRLYPRPILEGCLPSDPLPLRRTGRVVAQPAV